MGLGFGIRDPGSGKNLFRIPDPGFKKAPDPESGSAPLIFLVKILKFKSSSVSVQILCHKKSVLRIRIRDPDPPDPHVFGSGSGSISQRYGSGSGSVLVPSKLQEKSSSLKRKRPSVWRIQIRDSGKPRTKKLYLSIHFFLCFGFRQE
jgi:hypothetical protein